MEKKSRQALQDAALITIILGEDKRAKEVAFNQLFDNHKKQVLTFFRRNGGTNVTTDDVEDLSMVTFTKVHCNISSYDEKFAFSTWLYTIADRTLIDFLRKKNVEVISIEKLSSSMLEDDNGTAFQVPSSAYNPEEVMVKSQNYIRVHNALNAFEDDNVRQMMKLRFLEELSYEEIAKEMGIEMNSTIRVTVLRGKEKLAELLTEA